MSGVADATLLLRAAAFAARQHRDQRRKNGDVPYVNHPIAVAASIASEGGVTDPATLAAALLHDTIEDTGTTHAELVTAFGREVADVVAEVTDDKTLPKVERKRHQVEHARGISPCARLVKLADKLDNLRDIRRAPPAGWSQLLVRGYFCWAHAVVEALGPANAGLWQALQDVFASPLTVGGASGPALPATPAERDALLRDYYAALTR